MPHGHFLSPDLPVNAFTPSVFSPPLPLRAVLRLNRDFCIVRLRGKPPVYEDAESDAERDVAKCPHNACSKLLILQGGEPTWPQSQVSVGSIERYLGKPEQHCQNNVLCDCNAHAHHASKVAQARMEW